MVIALSIAFHLLVVVKLGGYRVVVDHFFDKNATVEMPAIMQMRQLEEEYTVNLEKKGTLESPSPFREMPLKLVIDTEASATELENAAAPTKADN
ncbi:MAG: hypothetical protein AAF065_13755 [Verrucomicrobiota bacterium]